MHWYTGVPEIQNSNNCYNTQVTLSMDCVSNNSIIKNAHSTLQDTWSDHPGYLPAFLHGEEPGYVAIGCMRGAVEYCTMSLKTWNICKCCFQLITTYIVLRFYECWRHHKQNIAIIKVTGTCSWIKLVCQKLACITFPTKKLLDIYNNQSLQRAFSYNSA